MCGGGSSAPPPVDPVEEARAQILVEQERARLAEEQRLRELEREAAEAERLRTEFLGNLDSAAQGALLRGRSLIEQRGLPFEEFEPLLSSEIQAVRQSVPFLDPNPSAFFAPDIADIVLNRARDQRRREYTNALQGFAAPGFARELLPNTADDAILDAILNEQFTPASDQILRAFQRGNLTQTGFNTARDQLQSQRETAQSRLQDVGGGVLTNFRNELRGIADTGYNRAGTFELGQVFDPESIRGDILSTADDLRSRLGGSVRGALGGEQLFNIEDLISRAGIAQGAQNPGAASPAVAEALANREKERAKPRGLGSQGVF